MGFYIAHTDIIDQYIDLACYTAQLSDELDSVLASIRAYIDDSTYAGQFADASKAYFGEMHGSFICALQNLISAMNDRYLVYYDSHTDFDSSATAEYTSPVFENVGVLWKAIGSNVEEMTADYRSIAKSISDIVPSASVDDKGIKYSADCICSDMSNHNTRVEQIENDAYEGCKANNAAMNALRDMLTEWTDPQSHISVGTYCPGVLTSMASAGAVFKTMKESKDTHAHLLKNSSKSRKRLINSYKSVKAEERTKQAEERLLSIAIASVVLVISLATAGVGGVAVVDGIILVSEGTEAMQDYYYGKKGDATSKSVGLIKDEIFLGNEKAYNFAKTFYSAGKSFSSGEYIQGSKDIGEYFVGGSEGVYDEKAQAKIIEDSWNADETLDLDHGEDDFDRVINYAPSGFEHARLDESSFYEGKSIPYVQANSCPVDSRQPDPASGKFDDKAKEIGRS